MEDTRLVFSNIMEKLLKQAQKNKNVLEYKEVNDAFKNIELTPEKFEWILDYFEKQGVDVLNTNEDEDNDDNFIDDDAPFRTGRGQYRGSGSYVFKRDW